MHRRRRSKPSQRRRPLSAERILRVAVSILDREGLDALSMRRLAERLRVSPMALYNHVRNKQELTERIADVIIGEFATPGNRGEWHERLRTCFGALRTVCLSHPHAVPLIERMGSISPAVFRPMEAAMAALRDAGFSPLEAMNAYCALIGFTMGQLSYQLRKPVSFDPSVAVERRVLSPEDFPNVVRVITAVPNWDFDRAFAFGLDVIIDGLRARAKALIVRDARRATTLP
jgi:TetR/AcrR family transcriptional regulator, tetracycline repressor protein